MARPTTVLEWHLPNLAASMRLKAEDVHLYFTDGRRVSFLLERRIAYEVLGGTLAPSEGTGWDVQDSEGNKWEVRSISKGRIYFCPTKMVGSGRTFNASGFLDKLDEISGYVVSDITQFPRIPVWVVPVAAVRDWWAAGQLGRASKVTRDTALTLLEAL